MIRPFLASACSAISCATVLSFALCACSEGSITSDGGELPTRGGNFSGGGGAGSNLGGINGGSNASGGAGSALGGNASGGTAGNGAGGLGTLPDGPPTGVKVELHNLPVTAGTVFNVADNYFRDRFIPATPVANFGLHAQIIPFLNADGSLDVAWLDYTEGDNQPWALDTPGMIYITHVDAELATSTTQPSGISSYKLLGFTKDAAGSMYLAYNRDHAMKTQADGDKNNLNGNELHIVKLGDGAPVWDQLIFGDQDNNVEASLGDPGGAASSVLGYDSTNDRLVIYLGHTMMWDDGVRHQAGFLRILNPSTGTIIPPDGNDIIHFGAGWWYSHNFNQRMIIDGDDYFVLAHGDAYARQLGFAKWSFNGYTNENDTDFDESYWDIDGNQGDNNTDAQTGQFARLSDGRFAIVHTTSQGRSARDVRLVLANGANGAVDNQSAVWLTENQGETHATMPKVEVLGEHLLVTYALWSGQHNLTWYAALLDTSLTTVAAAAEMPGVEFVDSAPLFRFSSGPYAGTVGWVSGNPSHSLSVGVVRLSYE